VASAKVFISYSHADEWLKDELVAHFGALKRNGLIDVWHDRRIPPGGLLESQIDSNLQTSDLCLFLISAAFVNSDYCFHKEYEEALKRHSTGETEIVPIIVRPCDWDVGGLRRFNALPRDGAAITLGAEAVGEGHRRDSKWLEVVRGVKEVLEVIKKKSQPPKVLVKYYDELFTVDFIRHPLLSRFDERLILVDPDLYCETKKEQVSTFERLFEICSQEDAVVITGADRSGKTLIAKNLHQMFSGTENPAILINGKQIRNKEIVKAVAVARDQQFEKSEFALDRFRVIIDDFDECSLPDHIKEAIVESLCEKFSGCIIFSFSSAPSVLFASSELPSPVVFLVNAVNDAKIYTIVQKWGSIGVPDGQVLSDDKILPVFEKVLLVFNETGVEKYLYTAATFLQFIDTLTGSDISLSSYAACYDIFISAKLNQAKVNAQSFDEARNFLALVAYRAYQENSAAYVRRSTFEECLTLFEEQFFSSKRHLKQMSLGNFLRVGDDQNYVFNEEYLWFFLCARYVSRTLAINDNVKYVEFVRYCTANIFQRKFANIVIFIAFFSSDKLVLECLLQTLDSLFSKAPKWVISDDTRELIMGIVSRDALEIESSDHGARENRMALLQERLADIIDDAEGVVARYTLPFLSPGIGDATDVESIDVRVDEDSYIRSVNALMRIHSVIGQILSARSGTFSAALVLDCITRMVQASGRYVALNHAIAAVLMFDKEFSVEELKKEYRSSRLSPEEKYEKVTRIFAFWSVYISHAGLARYLDQEHSIRALDRLVDAYESSSSKADGQNLPFNFTFVRAVARLYNTGRINRHEIDEILQRYGESSSIIHLLRVVVHMYAYYMPLSIEDKQWVSEKLNMPIGRIEMQRLRAINSKARQEQAVRGFLEGR